MSTTTVQKTKSDQDTINLFDLGVLVNLKVGTWSARKMITRSDLVAMGYENHDKLPHEICNLGRKLLIPRSESQSLSQIEQRARKFLKKFSMPFGICNAHFVPINMLPTIEQQIKELKTEFFARVDSFITRFDDLVETVKNSHPDFWAKCLRNHYPSNPEQLRGHFRFDWYAFKVSGMSSLEEVVAKQKAQDEKGIELRKQMQTSVGEFVGEYVTSMRNETVKFCNLMTARINGKLFEEEENIKGLTPRSISCFRNHIDHFRSMNIFADTEIENMLTEFRDTFLDSGVSPGDFESSTVKDSVTKMLATIRDKAAAEGNSGDQFIGELKRKIVI